LPKEEEGVFGAVGPLIALTSQTPPSKLVVGKKLREYHSHRAIQHIMQEFPATQECLMAMDGL
jgi:hypothetical protein